MFLNHLRVAAQKKESANERNARESAGLSRRPHESSRARPCGGHAFYETVLGFRVLSRRDTPHNTAVLARDQIQIGSRKTAAILPRTVAPSM